MAIIAYLHDGTSIYDHMFLEHLVKRNTVFFLTFHPKPRFIPKEARVTIMREPLLFLADKAWIEGIRMYTLFLLRTLLVKLELRRIKPQLVIGCMATKYGFYATATSFKPTIAIVWGTDVLISPRRFLFFRFLAKHTLKKADAVILDSKVQKNAAVQLGCNPDKILKFPWFNEESVKLKSSREETREKLGWSDNVIILSARSHETLYGIEHIIEAIPEIIKTEPNARFLILGQGRLTQTLKERVKQLQVSQYVRFLGHIPRDEVITYLNSSDINVSTSFSDGTSASLLEAMALAVPSVVTDIAGNKEWIESNYNGILTATRNPKDLAGKIVHLAQNQDTRKRLGKNAQTTIEQKVDWQRNMQTFDSLIQALIDKK